MINSNLVDFQRKFNLSNSFIETINSLFDKLIDFGYIGNAQKNRLIEKLIENVDYVIIGSKDKYDYKSGYYDANKKTLYIKEEGNIPAIYLRILYAISTTELDSHSYTLGFGTVKLGKTNYKIYHESFALNRAVFSNIVCKLLGSLPTNIGIMPTHKTFSHNFLGYDITADNDIYTLEGKILSELCFALNIDQQLIYSALFSHSPAKALERIFEKSEFTDSKKFLKAFDKVSREYSNYCKLQYLSKILNLNYIEMKKNVLNPCLEDLKIERNQINSKIESTIKKLINVDELDSELDISLAGTMENLENKILKDISTIQNMLADKIITSISYLSPYKYASKLKIFNDMLIFPNKKISDAVFNTIIYNLMPDNELTAINLIQKLRYSLINHILFNNKFTDISKKIGFYANIKDINPDLSIGHIFLTVNDRFSHVVEVSDLNKSIKKLNDNCKVVPTDNLKYLLNSDYSNMYVDKIEKVVSALREAFPEYKQTSIDNMFFMNANKKEYLIVDTSKKLSIFMITYNVAGYLCVPVELSDYFSLFYANQKKEDVSSLLPVMYKKKMFGKRK